MKAFAHCLKGKENHWQVTLLVVSCISSYYIYQLQSIANTNLPVADRQGPQPSLRNEAVREYLLEFLYH